MSKIKLFIRESWLLLASAFFFGLLLAAANAAWLPRIEQNQQAEINKIMTSLLPEAKSFEPAGETEIDLGRGKKVKTQIFEAKSQEGVRVGWEFNAEGAGFADKIKLTIAVDKNFEKIAGIDFTSINETPGFGDRAKQPYYLSQFVQVPSGELKLVKVGDTAKIDSEIVAITGATVTSTAVVNSVNKFVKPVKDYLQTKGLLENGK